MDRNAVSLLCKIYSELRKKMLKSALNPALGTVFFVLAKQSTCIKMETWPSSDQTIRTWGSYTVKCSLKFLHGFHFLDYLESVSNDNTHIHTTNPHVHTCTHQMKLALFKTCIPGTLHVNRFSLVK